MGLTRIRAQQISDIDYKQSVRVITVTNVTLSGGAPAAVDGVSLTSGNRVLVTGQSTASENGIYQVTTVGAGSTGTWTRSNDANETGEIEAGMIVMVTEGEIYGDTQWKLITNDPIVVGTTALTFVRNGAFEFGNIYANGTAVLATAVGDAVTFTAGTNVTITANAETKTVTFASDDTPPGGNTSEIQYNNAGVFAGSANLVFDGSNVIVGGDVVPVANLQHDLGNATNYWRSLYVGGNTIYLGNIQLQDTGNNTLGIFSADGQTPGNITATSSNAIYADSAGIVVTNSQPNITSVGTLSDLTVSGNIVGNNVFTQAAGQVRFYDTDNSHYVSFQSAGTVTGNVTWILPAADGTAGQVLATDGAGNLLWSAGGGGGGGISWTTQADTPPVIAVPGDFWYDSTTQIKYQYIDDGTGNAWVDQSFPTVFETITTGSIVNSNANGVGNIGSSSNYFNTVFAKATSAQYADLAEVYESDVDYPPATVVVFGGIKEVTISTVAGDTRVAGIVSTDPAFTMNTGAEGVMVALTGRVPCRVQGPVSKGDVLITSDIPGTAQRIGQQWQPGCVIGKSLQDIEDDTCQIIEVAVGRF